MSQRPVDTGFAQRRVDNEHPRSSGAVPGWSNNNERPSMEPQTPSYNHEEAFHTADHYPPFPAPPRTFKKGTPKNTRPKWTHFIGRFPPDSSCQNQGVFSTVQSEWNRSHASMQVSSYPEQVVQYQYPIPQAILHFFNK